MDDRNFTFPASPSPSSHAIAAAWVFPPFSRIVFRGARVFSFAPFCDPSRTGLGPFSAPLSHFHLLAQRNGDVPVAFMSRHLFAFFSFPHPFIPCVAVHPPVAFRFFSPGLSS